VAPSNIVYDFAPPHPLARRFETLWMVRQLVTAVRRHRPDVLFCAGNTYTIVALLVRLLLGRECPPIVSKLSNSLKRRDLIFPVRFCYRIWLRQHPRFIDHFIGLSEPMRGEILDFLGVEPDRVTIIPNPVLTSVDIQKLAEGPTSAGSGRRFVAVGRLTRQKNFTLLLKAFARIARDDDRLVIVGEGPQRKRLARKAATLGISSLVELPGHKPSVAASLHAADVFVSSSNYEGMPGAVVESLAAAMPIVATNSSVCLEHLLRHGELGQLVPIRDVAGLARALHNAPRREALPRQAMRLTAARYTIEQSAHLYLNALAAVTCTRPSEIGPEPIGPIAEAA
jgi:glycosyltransferase involved in cell wall biosynthesis